MKTRKMWLKFIAGKGVTKDAYRVVKLGDAVEPKIGTVLTDVEAKQYAESSRWKVETT